MNLDEIRKYLVDNEATPEVKTYLDGLRMPTLTSVQSFLDSSEDGRKWLQSYADTRVTKGLEAWRQNNLQRLIDEEIAKRFPAETEEQKRLRKLEQELAQERQARTRETQRNKAITQATQKGLPIELVEHFVGPDDDTTAANLSRLESVWQARLQEVVEARIKGAGREPHPPKDPPGGSFTKEQIAAMAPEDFQRNYPAIQRQYSTK